MDENPLNPAPEKPEETARLLPLNRRARRALIASERRQMGLRRPFGTQFWFPRGRKPTQKDPNDYMVDLDTSPEESDVTADVREEPDGE